ncbi:MAG: XRE family transcriptional regulator [Gemmatimonadaceae bacterium]
MPRIDPIPQLKREAGAALAEILARTGAHEGAALIGTDEPRVLEIRRGKLDRFSLETLIRYLARLGHPAELRIRDQPHPVRDQHGNRSQR